MSLESMLETLKVKTKVSLYNIQAVSIFLMELIT